MAAAARQPQWAHLQPARRSVQLVQGSPRPQHTRTPSRSPSARCRRRGAVCSASADLPPGTPPAAVAAWCNHAFLEAANKGNLIKACLLISLEEEAAAQAHYAEAEGLGDSTAVSQRSVGTASTWSLERLQALAEEVTVAFYAQLEDLGVADAVMAVARDVTDSTLLTLHTDLVRSYPTQLITAVNHVLFERHGYRRQRRHGDPLDVRLSSVLDSGSGGPAALAVLYMELCARLSLPLQPVALEGGRYFVLTPADEGVGLSAGGEAFVIDPYSEGMLLAASEVRELFEVEGELAPCTPAQLLAGMLGVLRDAHWCAALGCPPEPIFAVPISVEVALGEYRDVEVEASGGEDEQGEFLTMRFTLPDVDGEEEPGRPGQQWWPAEGYHLQRALAAAQKRSCLLPGDLTALLEVALLLYFSKHYADAWQELGCVLQAAKAEAAVSQAVPIFGPEEIADMETLLEKVRLQLVFAESG